MTSFMKIQCFAKIFFLSSFSVPFTCDDVFFWLLLTISLIANEWDHRIYLRLLQLISVLWREVFVELQIVSLSASNNAANAAVRTILMIFLSPFRHTVWSVCDSGPLLITGARRIFAGMGCLSLKSIICTQHRLRPATINVGTERKWEITSDGTSPWSSGWCRSRRQNLFLIFA